MDYTGPKPELRRILVTGGAGFIGSHLCEKLIEQGYLVTGIDNMASNTWIKQKNMQNIRNHPNFTLIKADLLQTNLSSLLQRVDVVYHFAATPGVRSSWGKNFLPYLNNNIRATQLLLETAKGMPLKKFILASTSSIYGTVDGPTGEDHRPCPLSPYGVTKLAAEQLASIYCREFGLPLTVLRFFTVYGPRQRPDMAFHRFIKSILDGTEIKVYGDGNQIRDFTYIDDIVDGNLKAMYLSEPGTVFNLGGNTKASVNESILLLEDIIGRQARVVYQPALPGEPKETWADTSKARNCLNYIPKTTLKNGLTAEVEYVRELYKLKW